MESKNKMTDKTTITIDATVNAPIAAVWEYWTKPEHITKWNQASEDWHTPYAENDLRTGGKFISRMEARDGSFGFDFEGVYDDVKTNEKIDYTIADGRKVSVTFTPNGDGTDIVTSFEAEETNPVEMQRGGWQAILDSFKAYTETDSKSRVTAG